jgi:hypothetical protein
MMDNPYSHEQDIEHDCDPCEKCGGHFDAQAEDCPSLCEGCEGTCMGKPCHYCTCEPEPYTLQAFEDYCGHCGAMYDKTGSGKWACKCTYTSDGAINF